tara:strand:- start:4052 stop:4456 length:405 start_codon:yes stop_codon:yes gene_type:complete
MINRPRILLVLSLSLVFAQNSEYGLVGEWVFESMTTITKAEREEITILYNDENNLETLSFENSGAIKYNVMNEGVEMLGSGVWYSDDPYITIIVEKDTTYGTYQIENNVLSIIVTEDESEEYYGYSTILKYRLK